MQLKALWKVCLINKIPTFVCHVTIEVLRGTCGNEWQEKNHELISTTDFKWLPTNVIAHTQVSSVRPTFIDALQKGKGVVKQCVYCMGESEECLIFNNVNLVHTLSSQRFIAQVQCLLTAFDLAESAAVDFIADGFCIINYGIRKNDQESLSSLRSSTQIPVHDYFATTLHRFGKLSSAEVVDT